MQGAVTSPRRSPDVPEERTGYVWGIAIVAALGGLLFGYDWVVIGGAREFYELYFRLVSPALTGWVNSCALVGCLAGSLAAGLAAERYGRKPVLLAAALLFAVSSAMTGLAHSLTTFVAWRIVGGTAIGLATNVSPLYIAEISPASQRGRLVSLNQFAVVVGILGAQVVNWLIARPVAEHLSAAELLQTWNVQQGWRWMFFAIVVPSAVFTLAALAIPESPRWLLTRHREAEAQAVLTRVGGDGYARAELRNIDAALATEAGLQSYDWRELFRNPLRPILLIGVALAVLQQWTGINVLFNYAAEVYRGAGFGANDILLNIVITGAINLLFTILAMALVDRVGRRGLMLFGCLGIASSHILCAVAYFEHWPGLVMLLTTLSAIAFYALTLAPVTWVLLSEIFPSRARAQAISLSVSSLWIASFVLTYSFPLLNHAFGTGSLFLLYAGICLLGFFLVLTRVPETKGRSLEQIEQLFARR